MRKLNCTAKRFSRIFSNLVMDVTVIGHGSLMSGRGLSFSGTFQVREAFIIALHGGTRGFAKLSRYGDRFATDLEIHYLPLEARRVASTSSPNGEIEALALTVSLDDFYRLAKREGYSPVAIQRLAAVAQARKQSLANFLCELQAEAGHDLVAYRRQLFTLTGFTSAHYIPHPVLVAGNGCALIFLAPGFEGTGSDQVISVRQQTGIQKVMNTSETWRQKPTEDQLTYFLSCLLGGVHGINVRDLLTSVREEPTLDQALRKKIERSLQEEQEEVDCFLTTTGISQAKYRQSFAEPNMALARSGLQSFLNGDYGGMQ